MCLFQRGYEPFRNNLREHSYYSRSCFNCAWYGVEEVKYIGDKKSREEECQNQDVTEYDLIVDGNRIYCTQWEQMQHKGEFFKQKKSGRGVID